MPIMTAPRLLFIDDDRLALATLSAVMAQQGWSEQVAFDPLRSEARRQRCLLDDYCAERGAAWQTGRG